MLQASFGSAHHYLFVAHLHKNEQRVRIQFLYRAPQHRPIPGVIQ